MFCLLNYELFLSPNSILPEEVFSACPCKTNILGLSTDILIHSFVVFLLHLILLSRLTYGLDYKGNVCGDTHADPDLRELELRYWLNPNQVYESGSKDNQAKISNARTICLMDCPIPSEDSLNWVCDYPEGEVRLSVDDWIDRNYDYFADLTPDLRNTSLQLQGPCYPVIFPSVNGK